jgi:hypothetical protein
MARIKPLSFGIAPNSLLNNKNISLSAKGMYTYMNSKPENWEFSIGGLVSQLKEGKDKIKSTIKELEKFGYLERKKYNTSNGRWAWEYILKIADLPSTDLPAMVLPSTVNTPHIIKKDYNKKDYNKKDKDNSSFFEKKPYFMNKRMSNDLKWVIFGQNDLREFAGDKKDIVYK